MTDAVFTVSARDDTAVAFNSIRANLKQVRSAMSGLAAGLSFAGLDQLAQGSRGAGAAVAGLTSSLALLGAVPLPIAALAGLSAVFFALQGSGNKASIELQKVIDRLRDLGRTAEEARLNPFNEALASGAAQVTALETALASSEQQIASYRKQLDEVTGSGEGAESMRTRLLLGIQAEEKAIASNRAKLVELQREYMNTSARRKEVLESLKKTTTKDEAPAAGGLDKATIKAAEADALALAKIQEAQLGAARDLIRDLGNEEDKFNLQIEELTEALEAGLIDLPTFNARVAEAQRELMKALEGDAKTAMDQVSIYADQAARNMQSAFADFLFDPFKDGLDGMLKGFIDVIRRMIAEAAAAKIFEGAGGFFGDILGAIGLGGLPGRASGGPVSSGKSYLVGEKGPEVVTMGGSGFVTPNHALGGGGVTIHQSISFSGSNGVSPADVARIVAQANRKVKADIVTFQTRGYMPA